MINLIKDYKEKKYGNNRFNQPAKNNKDYVFFNFNHVYVGDVINDIIDLKFLSLNIVKNIHNYNNIWKPVLENNKDLDSIEIEDDDYLHNIVRLLSELWYYKSSKVLKTIQSGFRGITIDDNEK